MKQPTPKQQSKLTQKMRTPRTNRALKSTGVSFQTVHNAIVAQKQDQKQYNFYLDLQIPQKPQLLKINVSVALDHKVSDALIKALQKFNVQLIPLGFQLDLQIKNYAPRLPKKSGKPKLDMPCLDLAQKISDVKIQTLSIQIKNKQAIKRLKKLQVSDSRVQKQNEIKQIKEVKQSKMVIPLKQNKVQKQDKQIKVSKKINQLNNQLSTPIKQPKQDIKFDQIQLKQVESQKKPLVFKKQEDKKLENSMNFEKKSEILPNNQPKSCLCFKICW